MSIFPKKITKDESTIIHIRIKNYDNIVKFLQLRTYIENPKGKIVKRFNKDFILCLNSESEVYKDIYFEFKPKKNSVPGKYIAKTDLYYKGEVLHSLTIDHDYFYIEDLKVKPVKNSNKFKIINCSSSETKFNLILVDDNKNKKKNYKLGAFKEKEFEFVNENNELYLEYGNKFCFRIVKNFKSKVYIKNKKYNWKCINESLLLYDNKKEILLNNFLGYIWLCCDGIHTIEEIADECQISKFKLYKYLNKLKRMGLISLRKPIKRK